MWRVLGAVMVVGLLGAATLLWMRLGVLERQLALRERQLANHQAVLEAVARTGKIRESELAPHLERLCPDPPSRYEGGSSWSVNVPTRQADTTDSPEATVEFNVDGQLRGVYAYKP